MNKEQQAEIQNHLEANAKLLGEVVVHENAERQQIRTTLQEFHSALNRRESEVKEELTANHQCKMNELEEQTEKMRIALQSQDVKGLEEILKQIRNSS